MIKYVPVNHFIDFIIPYGGIKNMNISKTKFSAYISGFLAEATWLESRVCPYA